MNLPFNSVRRNALALVAVGYINDALTAKVFAKPVDLVVHFGNAVPCGAAKFVERALNASQRKVRLPCVIPNFGCVVAKQPYLAVFHNHADDVVRVAFSTGKIQRVNAGAV